MKKTILAMAVPALLIAGAANASVNLYNADGVAVDMSGVAEIQYIQKYMNSDTNTNQIDPYLRIDDADLIFNASIEVTEGLSAVAGLGFQFEEDRFSNGTTKSDELYVGLSSNFGTLTFGRQLLIADDVGNAKDHELGTEQINFVKTSGAQVIKWVFDNGMFYAGADIDLDTNVSSVVDGTQVIGARLGARYAGVDARVYYYDGKNVISNAFALTAGVVAQDVSGFNLEVDYVFEAFDFSASYGQVEYKDALSVETRKNEVDMWQVSAGYQANEKTYFAVGYDALNSSATDSITAVKKYEKHDSHSLYANVSYSLHSNARVYAEIGIADIKIGEGINADKDPNTGYVLGMEVKF